MDADGPYANLDLQQMDDGTYANLEPRKKEKPQRGPQSDIRWYKQVGVGAGLLCAVLAVLLIAVPLYLHRSNMVERQQLLSSLEQLQNIHDNLTVEKDQLETRYANLTKQADMMKRRLCESDGFTFGGGLCYYISTEKKNWTDSSQWCTDKQSNLIVIKSKDKEDLVASFNKRVWLGLTDRETEGSFQWVDGTLLTTPTYWLPGEPNNQDDEDCVEYYDGSVSGSPNRGWNDEGCSISLYWMCERVVC